MVLVLVEMLRTSSKWPYCVINVAKLELDGTLTESAFCSCKVPLQMNYSPLGGAAPPAKIAGSKVYRSMTVVSDVKNAACINFTMLSGPDPKHVCT